MKQCIGITVAWQLGFRGGCTILTSVLTFSLALFLGHVLHFSLALPLIFQAGVLHFSSFPFSNSIPELLQRAAFLHFPFQKPITGSAPTDDIVTISHFLYFILHLLKQSMELLLQ